MWLKNCVCFGEPAYSSLALFKDWSLVFRSLIIFCPVAGILTGKYLLSYIKHRGMVAVSHISEKKQLREWTFYSVEDLELKNFAQ